MPPVRVQCQNCEEQPLRELEADGELVGFVCSAASESEIESRSGCGALVTPKEYRELKAQAEAKGKTKNNASAPAVTSRATPALATTGARPLGGLGGRRPLSSLHGNTLHSRTPLHGPKLGAKLSSAASASAGSAAVAASASAVQPAPSSPVLTASSAGSTDAPPAATDKPADRRVVPILSESDSSSDSSSDEGAGGEDSSSSSSDEEGSAAPSKAAASTPRKAPPVSSTSTTPTKLPSSATSSPARGPLAAKAGAKGTKGSKSKSATSPLASSTASSAAAGSFNLSDPSVSRSDRMRAIKLKIAANKAKLAAEFEEKYGKHGDADTLEERENAARKQSGQAGDDFLACSQSGSLSGIQRAPIAEGLSVKGAEDPNAGTVRKAWAPPRSFGAMNSGARALVEGRVKAGLVIGRRLGARGRGFGGMFSGFKPLESPEPSAPQEQQAPPPPVVAKVEPKALGDAFEPLVIWEPTPDELASYPQLTVVEVPPLVCKWLRPHQREGVKFMCECVLGLKNLGGTPPATAPTPAPAPVVTKEGEEPAPTPPPPPPAVTVNQGAGAILADDMGLGKTLQSVALVYTLLTQGFERGSPTARKVIIVTPTSLVANWRNEIDKWLGKGALNVVALSEVGKDNIECGMDLFTAHNSKQHVLIVSYDTFRRYVDRLKKPGLCDLLICDEAHRLKNNKTSTYIALDSLPTKRRVLLSGTPMQNDLSEFFSMINFTNRRILGDHKAFRKYYEYPILLGREPEALQQDADEGAQRSAELSAIVNQFVLRRTNVLLKKHLPPKVIQVVCCRPSGLQVALYHHFLASKSVRRLTHGDDDGEGRRGGGGGLQALPLITSLKKLCNHPKLIYDSAQAASTTKGKSMSIRDAETGSVEKVPPALVAMFKSMKPIFERVDNGAFIRNPNSAAYSGKMFVLERLLQQVRATTTDRVVIVSNFTSALDVIASMCAMRKWDALRLDGTTSIKKRQQLVDQLSDHRGNRVFCFLLSSRAGGCGLNLIGANRLILFDPDWNPAVDKQAAARVWRDGQTKRCFIYRFLTTGTIEEKIYQRQLSKEGLSGVLGGSTADASLTKDELRNLFHLEPNALEQASDTHASLNCECLHPYQIKSEEEALKADEAHKAEAAKHAAEVAAAEAAAEARRREQEREGQGDGESETSKEGAVASDAEQPGAPPAAAAAAAAASTDAADGDTAMADAEGKEGAGEAADGAEGEGEGDGGGEGSVPSEEEDDDDDGADLDGFVVDGSDDDDAEEYGSKKKGGGAKAKAKKPSKKDGPRKQRKKRAAVGSLNYPQLHALTTSTLGQRGEPPEEELINWAHHATSNSIPDPHFRTATKSMPFTASKLPYVSFVFSCEVSGKAITGTSDAADALLVSARCEDEPTQVVTTKALVVSAAEALENHAQFMREYTAKQKKRAGVDSDGELPDLVAHPELRRHSTRVPKPVRNSKEDEPDAAEEDGDFMVDDPGAGSSTSTAAGRKRKAADHAADAAAQYHPDVLQAAAKDLDEATQQAIREAMGIDEQQGRGRGRAKKEAPAAKPSPKRTSKAAKAREEANMSDVDEGVEGGEKEAEAEAGAGDSSSSSVQELSPVKKPRVDGPGSAAPVSPAKRALEPPSAPARAPPSSLSNLAAPAKPAASSVDDGFLDSDCEVMEVSAPPPPPPPPPPSAPATPRLIQLAPPSRSKGAVATVPAGHPSPARTPSKAPVSKPSPSKISLPPAAPVRRLVKPVSSVPEDDFLE